MSFEKDFSNFSLLNYRETESKWLKQEQERLQSLSELLQECDQDWQQCFLKVEQISQCHSLKKRPKTCSSHDSLVCLKEKAIPTSKLNQQPKVEQRHVFDTLGSYEQKREQFLKDRRKEYLEYLKERNRMEHERRLMISLQQQQLVLSYDDKMNDFYDLNDRPDKSLTKASDKKSNVSWTGAKNNSFQVTKHASNKTTNDSKTSFKLSQKRPATTSSFLSMTKSKALLSKSGQEESNGKRTTRRQKAQEYQEQLRQQIEQKRRLLQEEEKKNREDDQKIERRLEEQRAKMLEELEQERKANKQRLELINERELRGQAYLDQERQQKFNKNPINGQTDALPKPGSANYLYVRTPKNTAPLGRQQFRLSRINLNEDL